MADNAPPALPLFVAVNTACNLHCWYCATYGENRWIEQHGRLTSERLGEILEVAHGLGTRQFRFTGGEPTLRRDLPTILTATQQLGEDVRIAITTNGFRLASLIGVLAELNRPKVFLSVDGTTMNGSAVEAEDDAYKVEKWLTPELLDTVMEVREVAEVRLNYVLTRSNARYLLALIDLASDNHLDVKIFELLLRDFHHAIGDSPLAVFRQQYMPVRNIVSELQERYGRHHRFNGLGGKGVPMYAFDTGTSRVIYFDTTVGSHYSDACSRCKDFPCQEGLYSLVLNANGILHPSGGCTNPFLSRKLAAMNRQEIGVALSELVVEINAARFIHAVPHFLADLPQVNS